MRPLALDYDYPIAPVATWRGAIHYAFQQWLEENDCYVFTMNGFPFGAFSGEQVKDQVYEPDWTTRDRVYYTIRLANQLSTFLPEGQEGSISTCPLSYKPWHPDMDDREAVTVKATEHLLEVVEHLIDIEERTGKYIHIDLEPEPDGLLEDSRDVIDYWQRWLLPMGIEQLSERLRPDLAENAVRRYVQVCYDVCHFAVEYEDPELVIEAFREKDIRIGKLQISAALKAELPADKAKRESIKKQFEAFNEPTYLHQVIARDEDDQLIQYEDLPFALEEINDPELLEWRAHFHVPLFVNEYKDLRSTSDEVRKVLQMHAEDPISDHLEVETYTWHMLPESLQVSLQDSITRELRWVLEALQ